MNIIIRFWDNGSSMVVTRYLTSVFLGHTTSKDLEGKFMEGLAGLSLNKLVQISSIGDPNINWIFLESFLSILGQLRVIQGCSILALVDCTFMVHFKLVIRLRAGQSTRLCEACMYGLFKDSPACRADYPSETGSTCFPKKFCQVRWLENADVAARAIEIFPHVNKYVEKSEKAKKLLNNLTCSNITAECADPLALAKL